MKQVIQKVKGPTSTVLSKKGKLPKLEVHVPTFDGNAVHWRLFREQFQAHVSVILDAPNLKEGSGRELRHLHDTVNQHLHTLKSMDYEPSGHRIKMPHLSHTTVYSCSMMLDAGSTETEFYRSQKMR